MPLDQPRRQCRGRQIDHPGAGAHRQHHLSRRRDARVRRALASLGAHVAVPTSLNVSGVDECGWKDWAVSPEWAAKAARQMLAYERMGASPTWTCAPYQTK